MNTQVFLWRNHTNMNNVFRRVHPVYAMDTYIFKMNVFTVFRLVHPVYAMDTYIFKMDQAKYE